MTNKILILGSGTSTGIPIPGCLCEVCLSTNLKNKRLRTSIILKFKNDDKKGHSEKTLLIDTTPDLRQGLLNHKINNVDAAIITHTHADHLHGIDDLRPLCFGPPSKTIPIYTLPEDKQDLVQRFPYIFASGRDGYANFDATKREGNIIDHSKNSMISVLKNPLRNSQVVL